MVKSEFYDIVNMENIAISIPNASHFSLATSPYYAHQHGLAIDVYHELSLENYQVFSPVSGRVIKIKVMIAPKPKFKDGINKEYLILISNSENAEIIYKMLHVKPILKEGERIETGDIIGSTIRNGYFAYWSSPHLHLEIRNNNDAIRARGGKDFSLLLDETHPIKKNPRQAYLNQIPLKIHAVYPEFLLGYLPKNFYYKINPIYGVKININEFDCILDGGIPQYKNGMVLCPQKLNSKLIGTIYLNNCKIGTLSTFREKMGFFEFENTNFLLNNERIRGLSLYLSKYFPLLKIIPYYRNAFSFNSNSIQNLSIINNNTHII